MDTQGTGEEQQLQCQPLLGEMFLLKGTDEHSVPAQVFQMWRDSNCTSSSCLPDTEGEIFKHSD